MSGNKKNFKLIKEVEMIKNKSRELSKLKLPSNIKFGFFFAAIFLIASVYVYYEKLIFLTYSFVFIATMFSLIAIIKPYLLLPLNKFWMKLAHFLGTIINPIVLGIIFFGLLSPISLILKILRRDELVLKFKKKDSYWITRESPSHNDSFKNQF